jgi:hypothetical protein
VTITGGFVKEFPETKAQLIRNQADTDNVFDSNDKLKLTYLPTTVFDGLRYVGTVSANGTNSEIIGEIGAALNATLVGDGGTPARSGVGLYWVINVTGTIADQTTAINGSGLPSLYMRWTFNHGDGGASTQNSGVLEVGDWIVIDQFTGAGTQASPYVVRFSAVNNVYENASETVDGIVRLSSQASYANLTGNDVVTDGRLKTLIDNAGFATGTHTHGNLLNDGRIVTNTAAADGQHLVITNSSNDIEQSAITLGTTTTTFLNNAGAWATPAGTYSHPAYTTRSVDTSGVDVLDTFSSDATGHVTGIATRTLPNATTSAAGVMSSTDKTKLDGIAASANNYTHPNHSGDVTSAGDGATTIGANKVTNAKFRQSVALSIVGNATNGNADVTDIAAATDGDVLRRSGTAIGFGTIATAGITNAAVTFAKIQNSAVAGLSVVGRSAASAGAFDEIAAATDGHVLRRSGSTLGFGTIATAGIANNAVDNTKFRQGAALSVVGVTGNAAANVADIAAATDHHVLRRSGAALGFGLLTGSNITTNTIANANLSNVSSGIIKGRLSANSGAVEDLTAANVRSIIGLVAPIFVQTSSVIPVTTVTHALWYDIT